MVDNRYATALVIGSVLSLMATVYLSVAVGTQHWFQYSSPPLKQAINLSTLKEDFISGDFEEKNYSDTMFRLNGTLGLWWRCIQVPSWSHWYKEPGLCSLGTVCCFRAGVDLLHHNHEPPSGVDGSMGWSLYLALISFPLQMMAAALFLWAAKSHRKSYTRMVAYRVA
uniref:Claudin domain containing 1 n=1 Tax=Nothobranchius kadleci TaxID=1051664 RepID=A0A1A8C4U8_NOTKA